jgi:hypothetical protein
MEVSMAKTKGNKQEIEAESNPAEAERKFNRFLEEAKITNDYLKHIATLDTGSIVIMATFVQRYDPLYAGSLLVFAVMFLVASLAGVVATQIDIVNRLSSAAESLDKTPHKIEKVVYRVGTYIAYIGFILGLACLGTFIVYTIANISK